ncbi:MAG: hypothetical protein DI556_08735 [Rhodovulum sulfidophilum]|uniref:Uncharacterized protein n=1 Tax=Rhodovulum sulfidophilum TaxID=35806 RepID=A0A2W5Q5Z7_RHOSU|nr:MAG: hypothetical protein DI556_08735 [Rhodovulum sulfidophilum]
MIRPLALLLLTPAPLAAEPLEIPALAGVAAGRVVTIADADHLASTYADGVLNPDAGAVDRLTVLTAGAEGWHAATAPVSNSVTAAPEILAVDAPGAMAYVVERLGPREEGVANARDLRPGTRLFAIDLDSATVTAEATIAALPEALALAPDGDRIATVSNPPEGAVLRITAIEGAGFGATRSVPLRALGIAGGAPHTAGGLTATNVQWHPSGEALALNLTTQDRVLFLRETDAGWRVWGEAVETGRDPFVGRFTPDGGWYLTSDWGRDFTATDLPGRLPEQSAAISVIRVGDLADAAPAHRRVGSALTDMAAEGLAISPDGTRVATINMRGTTLPEASGRRDRMASVSLLAFDAATGALAKIADSPLDGALPEGGAFSTDGAHLLATVYEPHPEADGTPESGAGLAVFRVTPEGLTPQGRVPLPRGTHHVAIAR